MGLRSQWWKKAYIFLVDGYEPGSNRVYQFHQCHWHDNTYMRNRTKKQNMKYKDTWQTDRLIVSLWGCEKPTLLKKVWFDKEFTLYLLLIAGCKRKAIWSKWTANISKDVLKRKNLGLRRLVFRYLTSSMISLVTWGNCLLLKKYLIVIYLKQWKCIKKIAEKQSEEPKSYLVLKKGKRSFCKWL